MPYSFEWAVNDKPSYNDFGHQETSDGKVVTGSYNVALPDGRTQIVNYQVKGESGYIADVKYEGEPKHPKPAYPKHHEPAYPKHHEPAYPKHHEPAYPKHPEPAYPKHPKPAYPKHPKPAYPKHHEPAYPEPDYPEPAYH